MAKKSIQPIINDTFKNIEKWRGAGLWMKKDFEKAKENYKNLLKEVGDLKLIMYTLSVILQQYEDSPAIDLLILELQRRI